MALLVLSLVACGGAPGPLASLERVRSPPFEGTVTERVDASGYAYLRLADGQWVVGLDKGHREGDAVRVVPVGVARGFESARTGRRFDVLTFGVLQRP
jgi:hypothetical protein